jgi:hypothetical protein
MYDKEKYLRSNEGQKESVIKDIDEKYLPVKRKEKTVSEILKLLEGYSITDVKDILEGIRVSVNNYTLVTCTENYTAHLGKSETIR